MGGLFAFLGLARPCDGGAKLRAEQRIEGRVELSADGDAAEGVLVAHDEDPAEQCQVELLADVVGRGGVGIAAVLGQIERGFQVLLDNIEVRPGRGEFLVDAEQRGADAVLFAAEEVDGDGSGVVGFHELVLLADELLLLDLQRTLFFFDLGAGVPEFFEDGGFDTLAEGGVEADVLVMLFDLLLYFVDEHGLLLAGGAAGVTSRAVEVRVLLARPAGGDLDEEAFAAGAAVDGALQVVRVLADAFAVDVRRDHVLHLLPNAVVDEARVLALEVGALELDHLLVVRASEHLVQVPFGDRLRRHPRRGHGGQPLDGEVLRKVRNRPFTGGVELKRAGDERGAVLVEDDGAQFPAFVIDGLDVAVADGSAAVGAAGAGFHAHTLEDLDGQVLRVELVHRGEDAVQQHPGRCLIDRLCRGHQTHFPAAQRARDVAVVVPVSRQPVELVDDDVVDLVGVEVVEHRVQVVTACRAGAGFAAVFELFDDDRAEAGRLALVGFALRRDRESFGVTSAAAGLPGGGYAQVGHGPLRRERVGHRAEWVHG